MKREADHGRALGDLIPSASVAGNHVWEIGSAAPSLPVLEGSSPSSCGSGCLGYGGYELLCFKAIPPYSTIKHPIKMRERQWQQLVKTLWNLTTGRLYLLKLIPTSGSSAQHPKEDWQLQVSEGAAEA